MQTQKETIKNNIVRAALDELSQYGCAHASLRRIAESSGVSVGNIYSYFKNRDELLDHVLSPAAEQLNRIVLSSPAFENGGAGAVKMPGLDGLRALTARLAEVCFKYRRSFFVLFEKSEGSKFEHTKQRIIINAREKIALLFSSRSVLRGFRPEVLDALAASVIEGILLILKKAGEDMQSLTDAIYEYLCVVFGNIISDLNGPT